MSPPNSIEHGRPSSGTPLDRRQWHQPPPPERSSTFDAGTRVSEEQSTTRDSISTTVQAAETASCLQGPIDSNSSARVDARQMSHHKRYNATQAYTPRECYRTDLTREQKSTKAAVSLKGRRHQTTIANGSTKLASTKATSLRKTALVNAHLDSRRAADKDEERWEMVDREEIQDGEYELVDARDGAQEGLEEWIV